ncbi:hypothetical protein KSP39_PZI017565 [Platanthera zijinensis]|uniref:Uncharacterized protein n=1 Tax=Platanthera zijinensis TaxID=2320716 RepID=A0AAP0G034_9ASPA
MQGFTTVGVVDGKGRARKLPVRADIRRTLCFPGDATLMVAHLKKDIVAFVESSQHADSKESVKATANESYGWSDLSISGPISPLAVEDSHHHHFRAVESIFDRRSTHVADIHCHADERFFSLGQSGKRLVWEASLSSLKSKRVRGSHVPNDSVSSDQNCSPLHDERNYACFNEHTMNAPGCCPLLKEFSNSIAQDSKLKALFEEERSTQQSTDRGIKGSCPRIMFMNIADDEKKSRLTKCGQYGHLFATCRRNNPLRSNLIEQEGDVVENLEEDEKEFREEVAEGEDD